MPANESVCWPTSDERFEAAAGAAGCLRETRETPNLPVGPIGKALVVGKTDRGDGNERSASVLDHGRIPAADQERHLRSQHGALFPRDTHELPPAAVIRSLRACHRETPKDLPAACRPAVSRLEKLPYARQPPRQLAFRGLGCPSWKCHRLCLSGSHLVHQAPRRSHDVITAIDV